MTGGYNGWENFETWIWQKWLTDDEEDYRCWMYIARAVSPLGLVLILWEDAREKVDAIYAEAGPIADLLNSTINKINFDEIADALIEGAAEC